MRLADDTGNADYKKLLNQLESGEIEKIIVHPEEFMTFQTAYMNFGKRKRIIGTADQGGVITYVFERDEQEKKT
ncbi:hypothetical protein [Lentilactobacillus hilgardii]|uniref:Uncharacterized protein n=1 Tax=Lentilactobacillus hilgardii (strain ATCC 8290 / DSM 20176 / CCUG 30140 / JCM 1155 / KCTC 3500 / NBRC 15886 / NCIMB 8040 / NRRL B-1843 / 9) TaxID=1423757 RepID=C0XHT6_LENH9|nr:hypothetical protein [Lentilactobacillus hilgardii]EEI19131.1 hypothetical protein HMPREF0497_2082 [Lentilactobacillus buchneri ATCC 11577]EEI25059.1 hypothetical protein HMPREF0519_0797 [Lentilactobacillus hilgardii DSM 20176 = ATCC 8290]KRK59289.1 hypothetical protein FD42_GL000007 [Lentilactobacillus hilgardii DSM 20176 = ATCC 8290]MCP9334119.1 hypothetical protein [Lentilactobacillus hilgardii]MCP9350736.1 hypothetical protein [Lentilactobacillus hilgardii]